jgi:hypothetical protein
VIALGQPLLHVAENGDVTLTGSGLFAFCCVMVLLSWAAFGAWR